MTNKLKLTRTLGFELEGFVRDSDDLNVPFADVGWDGSLCGGDGEAVEVRTEPINDLGLIKDIYSALGSEFFNVNDSCGLHIHVDVSDYSVLDKAKLLRFGAGIELLMYALMEDERYYGRRDYYDDDEDGEENGQNSYCIKIHHAWRKLFRKSFISETIPFDTFTHINQLVNYINLSEENSVRNTWVGKYQWINANVSDYPTVEFRIFNATEDYKLVQKFGMLAYHLVETVKNSSVKQIQFIIQSIYNSSSLDEMYSRLFDSIGLDEEYRPRVQNHRLADYIYNKHCVANQDGVSQAV